LHHRAEDPEQAALRCIDRQAQFGEAQTFLISQRFEGGDQPSDERADEPRHPRGAISGVRDLADWRTTTSLLLNVLPWAIAFLGGNPAQMSP